jgi:hypothetical protein
VLRDLIERYLDNLKTERSFDSTFLALLAAEGYSDIHFTHGSFEFGKDFIAKNTEDGGQIQFAFQNKAGNVGAPQWREIRHQMFETLTNSIGGPSFDATLPRRTVLVLTGRLVGTAPVDYQQFAETMRAQFTGRTVLPPWDREAIVELLLKHGPEHLFQSGRDISSYGGFYQLYGNILESRARIDDIERHFDDRLHAAIPDRDRIAAVAIEAHLFADAAQSSDQPYLALQAMLAEMRAVVFEVQSVGLQQQTAPNALLQAALADVYAAATTVSMTYLERAASAGGVFEAAGGTGIVVTYPVLCTQLMDALVLECCLGSDDQAREAAAKLANLVSTEPGCAHPISDRYAVSIAWTIRALHMAGYDREARGLLKEAALWLIDRYWGGGSGLASCDSSESEEISVLFGAPFKGVTIKPSAGSLLATALMDAACFLQDRDTYDGLRKDILAADVVPRYYQIRDTPGQFQYGTEDTIRFPNVEFTEEMPAFETLSHGSHLDGEPMLSLEAVFGIGVYAGVSLLMRDRYFPSTWFKKS